MIISLISQKGGVGKSAVARLLAVEFTKAGWNVKIADLDPAQGTSAKWKARRDRAGIQPEIAVEKFPHSRSGIEGSRALRSGDSRRAGPCRTGRPDHGSGVRPGADADLLRPR